MCINCILLISDTGFGYKKMTSQKGNDLLVVDGYTFSQQSRYSWFCSMKSKQNRCEAKLKLNKSGRIIFISNDHCHPRKAMMYLPKSDTYIRI